MVKINGNFGKRHVLVTGGFAEIEDIEKIIEKIDKIDERYDTISQLFDATTIAGKNHILHASKLALEALESGKAFANSSSIELTCWVAGMRQINKSLESVGVKEDLDKIVLVTIGEEKSVTEEAQKELFKTLNLEKDESVLEIDEEKREKLIEIFSLSEKQLEIMPLEKLVLEKVALLSLEK